MTAPSLTERISAPASWVSWGLVALAGWGIFELGLHFVQVGTALTDGDWDRAKQVAQGIVRAEDALLFAPRWTEPVGRRAFGELMTLERAAFADVERFPRAVEISARGEHREELRGWKRTEDHAVGPLRVAVFENPSYRPVLNDLVSLVRPEALSVSLVGGRGDLACPFAEMSAESGNLGFGPTIPGARFSCGNGTFAGVSVVTDLDYFPHRCIYAPAPGAGDVLRLRFPAVKLGDTIAGHHGLYVEAERDRRGAPVSIAFQFEGERVGRAVHADGDGWKRFEFSTGHLKGQTGELVAEVSAPNANRRMYCFEAVTR